MCAIEYALTIFVDSSGVAPEGISPSLLNSKKTAKNTMKMEKMRIFRFGKENGIRFNYTINKAFSIIIGAQLLVLLIGIAWYLKIRKKTTRN